MNPVKAAAEAQKQKITNLFCVGVCRTAALMFSLQLLSETKRAEPLLNVHFQHEKRQQTVYLLRHTPTTPTTENTDKQHHQYVK